MNKNFTAKKMKNTFRIVEKVKIESVQIEKKRKEMQMPKNLVNLLLLILDCNIILYFYVFQSIERGLFLTMAALLGCFSVFYHKYSIPKELLPSREKYQDFGERIHFSDNEIKITSPIEANNRTLPLSEIKKFEVIFKGLNDSVKKDSATLLKINELGYTIDVEYGVRKMQLVEVLTFFYQKEIKVREIDGFGREMYLLDTNKSKPIPPKKEPPKPIEEKYLKMIEEIGKKEEEL